MRKTSGCCPPPHDLDRGFTLLEILLVMALLALMGGIVGPAGVRALEAARERSQVQALRAALEQLPLEAVRDRRTIQVDGSGLMRRVADWRDGHTIEVDGPLGYSVDGVATGGALTWRAPDGQVRRWRVEAVTGRVQVFAP